MKKYYAGGEGDLGSSRADLNAGIEFASHPVLAETDRDKFCILRIVDFYKQQPTDYADYFQAAWRYRSSGRDLALPNARCRRLLPKRRSARSTWIWSGIRSPHQARKSAPLPNFSTMWNALPAPEKGTTGCRRAPGCEAMRDWVLALRKKVAWKLRQPAGAPRLLRWRPVFSSSGRTGSTPPIAGCSIRHALQVGGVPQYPHRPADGTATGQQAADRDRSSRSRPLCAAGRGRARASIWPRSTGSAASSRMRSISPSVAACSSTIRAIRAAS